jgi:hypothetical protein
MTCLLSLPLHLCNLPRHVQAFVYQSLWLMHSLPLTSSGEATGGFGGLKPHLPPGQLLGSVQNRREIFLGGDRGYSSILLQPTGNLDGLKRSKQVHSKSSTKTKDGELCRSLCGASCLFSSSVFFRKALKIKRFWDFTKVYRYKCRNQCVNFV